MLPTLIIAVASLSAVQAHIALWDKGMFGLNYPYQSDSASKEWNNNFPVLPLREADGHDVSYWFGHGLKGFPPPTGDFMVLPAGGVYNGEVACNRAETTLRNPILTSPLFKYACSGDMGVGALHVMNQYNKTADPSLFGGTALAIAYTSDVNSLQPNDLTVISVNQQSVWEREISYQIPAGLPACPAGGCICSWNWIHQSNKGEGYPYEIYNLLYRCTVTGASASARPVQRGQVPRDCTKSSANCVSGPKTPMYLYQVNGNNMPHLDVPPLYNSGWGFNQGAQNDIYATATTPAPTTYMENPYATPTVTGTAAANRPTPTATTLPKGWQPLGCIPDAGQTGARTFRDALYSGSNLSVSQCVGLCEAQGYLYCGLENGNECWASNEATYTTVPPSQCDARCLGDTWDNQNCGGNWKLSGFIKVAYDSNTNSNSTATGSAGTAPATTSAAASGPGWVDLGCHVDQDSPRALNRGAISAANMTLTTCLAYAKANNYNYAGVESGRECWVGSKYIPNPSTGCVKPCAGDVNQRCGGDWRVQVFQWRTAAASSSSTASSSSSTSSASTTPPAATISSSSSSSSSATTTTIGKAVNPPISSTTTGVTSSSSTAATTPSASTTSRVTPQGYTYLGCWTDGNDRILTGTSFSSDQLTPKLCAAECARLGFPVAGVEFRGECWCGKDLSKLNKYGKGTSCTEPCNGDRTITCGGSWQGEIYANSTIAAGSGYPAVADKQRRSISVGQGRVVAL